MITLIILTFFFILALPSSYAASGLPTCELDVKVDVASARVTGLSRISVESGKGLIIRKGALEIRRLRINNRAVDISGEKDFVRIVPSEDGFVEIDYSGTFKGAMYKGTNYGVIPSVISDEGVSLTDVWYPRADGLCSYEVKVSLPAGYEAVSEADKITRTHHNKSTEFNFHFPYPLDSVNLTASKRFVMIKDRYRKIDIVAYFFKKDVALGRTYIDFTKKYIKLYEKLLGSYPYRRFSIVENFLPSGYSMPTFTLLGQSIVNLPFIVETSLGHEILHQWFGNSVYVDYLRGNWAEGLTSYLSDHLYREQKGEGWEYRKQILINYKSYVTPEKDIPIQEFSGRVDRSTMAIGYGKTAMVFHMLRKMADLDRFYHALRAFISKNRFRQASWDDIRMAFEKEYGRDLKWFFTQWISGTGLPGLTINSIDMKQIGSNFELNFSIDQRERIFVLDLPVSIYLADGAEKRTFPVKKKREEFSVLLPDRPRKIIIDEDYDIARDIAEREYPPVIARFIEHDVIISFPEQKREIYESVLEGFEERGAAQRKITDVDESDMRSSSFIILGRDNDLVKSFFGEIPHSEAGFTVLVRENPWNRQKVVAIIEARSKNEADAAFSKIFHYGKYSQLEFNGGINTFKKSEPSEKGMSVDVSKESVVVDIGNIKTLTDIIRGIAGKDIVYIGEVHDVFAHHAVQLDIISGMYKQNKKLAIGMEMFQRPFQASLDRFINGKMGEREFLKESEYFKRWGFEYNLYKPILDFARSERVPVIALNLEREIIERVSDIGLGALSEAERNKIPSGLDFSDHEYRTRLEEIFAMHEQSEEKTFDYFYQSQILWDETMSQSIDDFMRKNPEYQVAVLAGQGHLMYGSGIPKRTFRRNGHDYAIVLIDAHVEKGIADYVVFPAPVEGVTAPKLMTYLTEKDDTLAIAGFPEESVSEKAGLLIGDMILSIDEIPVTSIEDIKIHLLYKKRGDKVTIKIRRIENEKELIKEIEVVL